MPSSPPSFIRYFAQTDDSDIGKAALEYLKSMIRISPVRIASLSGGLSGAWHRYQNLLLTPMSGTYVNAVCTHPDRWVWTSSVPMTNAATGDDGLPAAPRYVKRPAGEPPGLDIELPDPQPTTEVAERVEELYTPKVRNVLFMPVAPTNKQQLLAAKKYQDVIAPSLSIAEVVAARWPDQSFAGGIVPVPVRDHARVREAIVGRS